MFYLITASPVTKTERGQRTEHLPLFYLNSHVHGIASERQARRVALSLLGESAVINDIYKTKGPQA